MTSAMIALLALRAALVSYRLLYFALFLLSITVSSQAQLVNGNFATGDLTGWTIFNDTNGTAGNPTVVLFDTTGSGVPCYSAQFNVGETVYFPEGGLGAGGGILQNVTLGSGQLTINLDVACSTSTPNSDGGTFQLLLDGVVGDSYATGLIGSIGSTVTKRATLNYTSLVKAGVHEIAIDIRRGFNASYETPNQYLANITLSLTNPPPPQLLFPGVVNPSGNQYFILYWSGLAGQTYQVQYTTNLATANWVNLTNAVTNDFYGSISVEDLDVIGLNPQKFYRIVALP